MICYVIKGRYGYLKEITSANGILYVHNIVNALFFNDYDIASMCCPRDFKVVKVEIKEMLEDE